MGQELLTISQTADLLLRGHPARAVDLLSQRFKALEQQARGAHWTVARQLELVSADSVGLSQGAEGAEAARLAREEARNRSAVQRPYNMGGKDGSKSKGRPDPPEGREKGDRGGKGKGKGKKKEKQMMSKTEDSESPRWKKGQEEAWRLRVQWLNRVL